MTLLEAIGTGAASTDDALALFDRLQPATLEFMQGTWSGQGFRTGHPLDGLLEACHWYGKRIEGPEAVQPLLFRSATGRVIGVRPVGAVSAIALVRRLPLLKSRAAGRLVQACLSLLRTQRTIARLRMTQHRGVCTATLVYDRLPILDVLRKVDDATALGLMDMKGMAQPLFFVLRREHA